MNKQLWTISMTVVLVGVLLFIGILNITNERNQLARKLDYDKVKVLYYIKDMPYKFHEHTEPVVVSDLFPTNQLYTQISESWSNGEKEITMILFETKFRYYNDVTFEEEIKYRAGPYHPITVKNVEGHYGSYTENVYAIEYIELVIDGVFYKITVQHTNPQFFGEDFMINFVNEYLVN